MRAPDLLAALCGQGAVCTGRQEASASRREKGRKREGGGEGGRGEGRREKGRESEGGRERVRGREGERESSMNVDQTAISHREKEGGGKKRKSRETQQARTRLG